MGINIEDTKHDSFNVLSTLWNYAGLIYTAATEKKWWRLIALTVLTAVMLAVVIFAKPLLITFFTKWFIGTWGLPLTVSKVAASCAGKLITTQLGNVLKYWVLKIDK
ncbi:hypothetical protein N1689_20670 [Pantoea sp. XY16]|uniref:hypothetical protein n=1 Tax=Pantoea sp. XY16 TaxID=2976705 RepID=UPI0021A7B1FB|nr:hypothetical protein [Pantoea sp. XY16]MCT2420268.1 hypothetical protein [Pantoea sp. XY16]